LLTQYFRCVRKNGCVCAFISVSIRVHNYAVFRSNKIHIRK
jgi:hypothetical protein